MTKCASWYDRAHCFAGEVAGCTASVPSLGTRVSVPTLRTLMWLGLWWEEEVELQCSGGHGHQEEGASGDAQPSAKVCPVEG